jgi:hypothetical protein
MWVDHLNSFSELEDSAVLSQDSLECLSCAWVQENGRPDSPLAFDHEEILRIDDDQDVRRSSCFRSGCAELAPLPSVCWTHCFYCFFILVCSTGLPQIKHPETFFKRNKKIIKTLCLRIQRVQNWQFLCIFWKKKLINLELSVYRDPMCRSSTWCKFCFRPNKKKVWFR